MNIPFIGPSYTSRSVNIDAQRSVNLYPEVVESQTGKTVMALYGTPGYKTFCTLPTSPVRGLWEAAGRLFAVGGNKLYEVQPDGSATERGALGTSSGYVSMADNGQQVCLVDGPNGYILNLSTNVLTQIASSGWRGSDRVAYQDGYFIFSEPGTGVFYISSLNDGLTIDTLDFASAEGSPDNIVGLISDHRELWLFGQKTVEVFYNSGNPDFPFERIQGAFIEHGCAAPHSIAKMDNSVFWLGSDDRGNGIVWKANGYQPQRISTHAVELAIQSYESVSDAVAYTYQDEGHMFYVLNFTNANSTWVYDAATGLWHERASGAGNSISRHKADSHSFVFGKHLVGDYSSGKIYEQDNDLYSYDGSPIVRLRSAPRIHNDLKFLYFSAFQLDMETGVGLDKGVQGSDPQVMLQWSDDGGHTWSNEHWVSAGKIGGYKVRARWRRLGRSRDRVFRVIITDAVKVAMIAANVEVSQGAS